MSRIELSWLPDGEGRVLPIVLMHGEYAGTGDAIDVHRFTDERSAEVRRIAAANEDKGVGRDGERSAG